MATNFEHCVALVREADRDRYLATLFAPAEHRDALYALYAFNLEIARVRDLAREPMPGEIRLHWWREAIAGERAGEAAAHPVAATLREALARYHLPAERLIALIDAHAFDLYDEPMATLDELDAYARQTQGVLLETAAAMLGGASAPANALIRHAGTATAVTGMLSLLGRHAARRQLFLPLEVLDRHKVAPADVFAMETGAPLFAALAELRRHARRQLAAARAEMASAPPEILPALLPVATAGATLKRMERRGYQPFQFEPPSRLTRQWQLWRAARQPSRIFHG
jgi:phytoene synthase